MKLNLIFNKRTFAIGLGTVILTGFTGCVTNGNPFGMLPGLITEPGYQRSVARNNYVYYPEHDVYYNQNAREFMSVENDRWVTRNQPRNVSVERVLASRSLNIDGYNTPQQHRTAYYQERRYRGNSRAEVEANRGWRSNREFSNSNREWNSDPRRVNYRRY